MARVERLTDRVVLITGAAGDLGAAIARRVHDEGAAVVLTDVGERTAELDELATSLRGQRDTTVLVRALDVTDEAATEEVVADVVATLGPPTGIVACAGVQGPIATLLDHGADDVRRVLEVNLVGTHTVVAACTRRLADVGRPGAVVLLASMAGVSGAPNMAAYSASKAAVLGYARTAAKDLAPHGIRVNAVSPAFIGPGAMWDRQVRQQAEVGSQYYDDDPSRVAEEMIELVPLRRYGSPAEVAAAVAFLLSDDSGYVTGVNLEVSGGSV